MLAVPKRIIQYDKQSIWLTTRLCFMKVFKIFVQKENISDLSITGHVKVKPNEINHCVMVGEQNQTVWDSFLSLIIIESEKKQKHTLQR